MPRLSKRSRLSRFALDGAIADVAAVLHQVPVDGVHQCISLRLRCGDAVAQAHGTEYAPAGGDDLRSVRTGEGAIAFPTPEEARAHTWTDEDRALVADRLDTQFVGSPRQVADKLEQLQEATGADELIITTITHDHADRIRSYRLLAEEWQRRSVAGSQVEDQVAARPGAADQRAAVGGFVDRVGGVADRS